jgi:hypothetical protein
VIPCVDVANLWHIYDLRSDHVVLRSLATPRTPEKLPMHVSNDNVVPTAVMLRRVVRSKTSEDDRCPNNQTNYPNTSER